MAIDFFARDPDAQILHVTHDRSTSVVRRVDEYAHSRAMLDDLDIRASDLLQSNGLVWVEGPSDRIYFRRWVDLWSEGKIREGIHYQCLFYGGKLLKHISCDDPGSDQSRVEILATNRNAIILIDSDLKVENKPLPKTKARIVAEMERIGGISWVTYGKEIENYLPIELLSAAAGIAVGPLRRDQVVWRAIDRVQKGQGAKFERDKVKFAEDMAAQLSRSHLQTTYDLGARLTDVCARIRQWNGGSVA